VTFSQWQGEAEEEWGAQMKRRTLRAFLYFVFAVIEDEQTGAPAFAIPLRTSVSWRPSVAG
jgi:hypothetical protein